MMWLDALLAEIAFDVGDWAEAAARLPTTQRWTGGHVKVNIWLRRASLMLGRGEHDDARRAARPTSTIRSRTRASRSSSGRCPC